MLERMWQGHNEESTKVQGDVDQVGGAREQRVSWEEERKREREEEEVRGREREYVDTSGDGLNVVDMYMGVFHDD